MNNQNASPMLARRFVEMGVAATPPEFPPDGVPLLNLVPYWRLWPREPNRNFLVHPGASIFPVIAGGFAPLQVEGEAMRQTIQTTFAAMLPIFRADQAVAQWVQFTLAASRERAFGGVSAPAAVLECLLADRPEAERLAAWQQVVEAVLDVRGEARLLDSQHLPALLECLGRSGLRALAPLVCRALRNKESENVLAAIACLARLGVPDANLPSDALLTRLSASCVETGRSALAFVETGDLDRFDQLLASEQWLERVSALRLVDALLQRKENLGEAWLRRLIELLRIRLQMERDRDVVRCLATTLGLALRQCAELPLEVVLEAAGQSKDEGKFECWMNALLIAVRTVDAGRPEEAPSRSSGQPASPKAHPALAARIEGLRRQAMELGADAVRALNRVMMSLGEPCGSVFDWLTSEIVALRQAGVLHLPEAVADWFDAPERCPVEQVARLLRKPCDHDLAGMFCAVYLLRRPEFIRVLEKLWSDAVFNQETDLLRLTGALLAGAPQDCAVSPAELRCCLGHEVGGPLPETPENVGRLLGLAVTLKGEVRKSAAHLLRQMPRDFRIVAGGALRWLPRHRRPFDKGAGHPTWFGVPAVPFDHAGQFPLTLQLLFSTGLTKGCPPTMVLETLAVGGEHEARWAAQSLDWNDAEAVRASFEEAEPAGLSAAFLRISSSPHATARRLAVELASGVGLRILQPLDRERIIQRLMALGQDGDAEVRAAVIRAAQTLGVAEQVPVAPIPPPKQGVAPGSDGKDKNEATDLDELLRQLDEP